MLWLMLWFSLSFCRRGHENDLGDRDISTTWKAVKIKPNWTEIRCHSSISHQGEESALHGMQFFMQANVQLHVFTFGQKQVTTITSSIVHRDTLKARWMQVQQKNSTTANREYLKIQSMTCIGLRDNPDQCKCNILCYVFWFIWCPPQKYCRLNSMQEHQ